MCACTEEAASPTVKLQAAATAKALRLAFLNKEYNFSIILLLSPQKKISKTEAKIDTFKQSTKKLRSLIVQLLQGQLLVAQHFIYGTSRAATFTHS